MKGQIKGRLPIKEPMNISVHDYAGSKKPKYPNWVETVNVTLFPDGKYEFEDAL